MISRLSVPGGPEVRLIDGQAAALDQAGLRERARVLAPAASHASRSYSYPYALVCWHTSPVGVDLERLGGGTPSFAQSIRTPRESMALQASEADDDGLVLWCSKEALAKALGDPLRYDPRRLESPLGWAGGKAGRWRATRLDPCPGYVAFVCWCDDGG